MFDHIFEHIYSKMCTYKNAPPNYLYVPILNMLQIIIKEYVFFIQKHVKRKKKKIMQHNNKLNYYLYAHQENSIILFCFFQCFVACSNTIFIYIFYIFKLKQILFLFEYQSVKGSLNFHLNISYHNMIVSISNFEIMIKRKPLGRYYYYIFV